MNEIRILVTKAGHEGKKKLSSGCYVFGGENPITIGSSERKDIHLSESKNVSLEIFRNDQNYSLKNGR